MLARSTAPGAKSSKDTFSGSQHKVAPYLECACRTSCTGMRGPEDLVATEEMLERITAPGTDFSGDFVEQFKLFTAELRDFFNAGSLADLLNALRPSLDDSACQASLFFCFSW